MFAATRAVNKELFASLSSHPSIILGLENVLSPNSRDSLWLIFLIYPVYENPSILLIQAHSNYIMPSMRCGLGNVNILGK